MKSDYKEIESSGNNKSGRAGNLDKNRERIRRTKTEVFLQNPQRKIPLSFATPKDFSKQVFKRLSISYEGSEDTTYQ